MKPLLVKLLIGIRDKTRLNNVNLENILERTHTELILKMVHWVFEGEAQPMSQVYLINGDYNSIQISSGWLWFACRIKL